MQFANTFALIASLSIVAQTAPAVESRAAAPQTFRLRFTSPSKFKGQVVAVYSSATRNLFTYSNNTIVANAEQWQINSAGKLAENITADNLAYVSTYPYSNFYTSNFAGSDTTNIGIKCSLGSANTQGAGKISCVYNDKNGKPQTQYVLCPSQYSSSFFLNLRNATTATADGCVPVIVEYF